MRDNFCISHFSTHKPAESMQGTGERESETGGRDVNLVVLDRSVDKVL